MSKPLQQIDEAFDSRVEKLGNESGCWLWIGGATSAGYGLFHPQRGVSYGAHRFAAKRAGMEIAGRQVCHKCDTPSCVNPSHLFVSDPVGNIEDKVRKNRQAKGQSNGGSRLSEQQAREVLELHKGGVTQKALREKFKMSKYAIWRIVSGNGWKHLHCSTPK